MAVVAEVPAMEAAKKRKLEMTMDVRNHTHLLLDHGGDEGGGSDGGGDAHQRRKEDRETQGLDKKQRKEEPGRID